MIYASPATFSRLGEHRDFLQALTPHPVIMLSPADYLKHPYPMRHLDEITVKQCIGEIAPELQPLLDEGHLRQCADGLREGKFAAIPAGVKSDHTKSCSLILLGPIVKNSKQALTCMVPSLNSSHQFFPRDNDACKLGLILILHELFHTREGHIPRREQTDFEAFKEELSADRYALEKASLLPGYETAIDDFITARQISAAHNKRSTHCTGLALANPALTHSENDCKLYHQAASRFGNKVRQEINIDAFGPVRASCELTMLLAPSPDMSLPKVRGIVETMRRQRMFEGLEDVMAETYLAAIAKWNDPANSPRLPAFVPPRGAKFKLES